MAETLEKVLKNKVKPLIDSAMHRFMGVTIDEIEADISDKLRKSPLLEIELDTSLPLKKARNKFRKTYLLKLLHNHLGNISKVAEIAGTDRRTIHRVVGSMKIDVDKIRKEMLRYDYIKREAVKEMIEDTLDHYKNTIKEQKLKSLYKHAPKLSKDILKELPEEPLTLKEAEAEFERLFIKKALQENKTIRQAANALKIRPETLHRKIKSLGISK